MLQYLLKFSISLAVLYIFYRAVLRPLTFYKCNRFYLLCYSLLSFVIPFINITPWVVKEGAPDSQLVKIIPAIGNYTGSAEPVKIVEQSSILQNITWSQWLLLLFCLGVAVMIVRIIYQYSSLRRIRSKSVLLSSNSDIHLYQTNAPVSPFSFGNAIYFNSSLHTEEELQRIIQHEFVHVKQKHSVDILIGELLCIVNWFNPFAWFIRHAIRQNLEFIADNDVIKNGIDKKEYQYLLLKAVGIPQYSIANNFNFSNLKKRIAMMNKMKSAKLHLSKFLFVLPLLAVLLLAFRNNIEDKANQKTEKGISANDTIPSPPAAPAPVPGAVLPAPTPLSDNGGLPENVSSISHRTNIDLAKKVKEDLVTVKLKNGTKEVYNFYNADEKAAYIKKYGELPTAVPPVAPVPRVPAVGTVPIQVPEPPVKLSGTNQENVENITTSEHTDKKAGVHTNTAVVTLKDGTKESYNLSNPKEKADYIKKYGELPKITLPIAPVPAVPPVNETPPSITINGVQQAVSLDNNNLQLKSFKNTFNAPLYIVDGRETSADNLSKLSPNEISSITVLKDKESVSQYGEKAANGVIIIATKKAKLSITANELVIIDGREIPAGIKVEDVIQPKDIGRMQVYSGSEAVALFGDKGKNNVIEITTKKYQAAKKGNIQYRADSTVRVHFDQFIVNGSIVTNRNESIIEGTFSFENKTERPLVIFDGRELTEVITLSPDNGKYRMVTVSANEAVEKYGEKAKYGAIEITTLRKGNEKKTM